MVEGASEEGFIGGRGEKMGSLEGGALGGDGCDKEKKEKGEKEERSRRRRRGHGSPPSHRQN